MHTHDFTALFAAYPAVIAELPACFTSHEFIRALARQQQCLYIEALYAYRHTQRAGKVAPFLIVHGILAQQLERYPELVRKLSPAVPSTDLFGNDNAAALWEKC
jgi:hypothetical protein